MSGYLATGKSGTASIKRNQAGPDLSARGRVTYELSG